MIRALGRMAATMSLLLLIAWPVPGSARTSWQLVRSSADNFAAMFPGRPNFSRKRVNGTRAVQDTWAFNIGDRETYQLAVISYPPGTLPAVPTVAYYTRLCNAYAHGSKTRLRSQYATTISGHPAAEAIFDDATGANLHHLFDAVVVGSRLYIIVSAGPRGHEASSAALRFRNSFQLIRQ